MALSPIKAPFPHVVSLPRAEELPGLAVQALTKEMLQCLSFFMPERNA